MNDVELKNAEETHRILQNLLILLDTVELKGMNAFIAAQEGYKFVNELRQQTEKQIEEAKAVKQSEVVVTEADLSVPKA